MKVSLQDNVVTVGVAPDASVDLRAIPAEISRVGFKPADMRVRAIGTIEGGRIRLRGSETSYPLAKPVHPAPDTEIEFSASVDYSGSELAWTVEKMGR